MNTVPLNDDQFEWVMAALRAEGLDACPWPEEMVDHYCCFVEASLAKGIPLSQAFQEAKQAIAPQGLPAIEKDFIHQLKTHKMKNALVLFGFMACAFVSLGLMFKTFSWPGAQIILVLGYGWVLISSLLFALYLYRHRGKQSPGFWLRAQAGLISVGLIALGFAFKAFQFTGANMLIGGGMIAFNLVFLPSYFLHLYRQKERYP